MSQLLMEGGTQATYELRLWQTTSLEGRSLGVARTTTFNQKAITRRG